MPDLTINTQEPFEYRILPGSYRDPASQPLTYTTNIGTQAGLKGWLRFSQSMMCFYGVPPIGAAGTYSIQLRVSDPFGGIVTDTFDLKVNAKPAIPTSGTYGEIDKEFRIPQGTFVIPLANYFTDPDVALGDTLTYSIRQASGLSVGSWV
jgi:hypothetical protein